MQCLLTMRNIGISAWIVFPLPGCFEPWEEVFTFLCFFFVQVKEIQFI